MLCIEMLEVAYLDGYLLVSAQVHTHPNVPHYYCLFSRPIITHNKTAHEYELKNDSAPLE
jgi:hypothetical protein